MSWTYARVWRFTVTAVLLVATLAACLSVPLVVMITFYFLAAVVTVSAIVILNSELNRSTRVTIPSPSAAAVHGLRGGLWLVGTIGLVNGLGGLGVLVALALVGSAPAFVRRQAHAGIADCALVDGEPRFLPASTGLGDVTGLSTAELIHAWRASYPCLLRARTVEETVLIAARRQQYIDELERRDPSGFERWLSSGARAASDPSRFVDRDGDGGAALPEAS